MKAWLARYRQTGLPPRGLKGLALGCGLGLLVLAPFSPVPLVAVPLALVLLATLLGLYDAAGLAAALRRASARQENGADEGRLHAVLDALSAPMVLIDRRAFVVHANAAARTVWPALSRGVQVAHVIRAPALGEALARLRRGEVVPPFDLLEPVPVARSFSVQPGLLGGENARGAGHAVLFMPETTDARRIEAMRADFVANASHELRTPLASILGFVETLRGPARNDAAARERFLGIMEEQARRMARLIEDLLSLSRIEMSEHIPPAGRVEMVGALRSVLDALSGLARERGVSFETRFAVSEASIPGVHDEILRVIENLVENAIKYGQSGGRVQLLLDETSDAAIGPALCLVVRDFGAGIAPEHLPRLTERFYRADVNASRGQGGTGLGLAIVKHIVNRHRGRLHIASRLGEGTRVSILLPRGSSEPSAGA